MEPLRVILQKYPTLSVLVFAVAFRLVHRLLRDLPIPKHVEQDKVKSWRWRNLTVSLVHSLLTGPWAVLCVFSSPEMTSQIYSSYTTVDYLLVCISSGYFVQDAADIILSGQSRASWEFLVHHAMVLLCFMYAIYSHHYVGGTVVALLVEVNSVFLHTRLLLKLASAQDSGLYRVNKYINLVTYVTFRLSAQFYLTWYIVQHFHTLDHAAFFLFAMVFMNGMILVYFQRLVHTDFLRPKRRAAHCGKDSAASNNSAKFVYD
ncbi:TLC domain-containing protein 1-like [Acipenser oxyrinchus oxyrinchus]|uniref:TLC domain-containing protein 1-like n=1 Tax=Acipenser oxyrinchus oxyrinchus TaxID=40147 RepID=A0AAD8CUT9_ACIOX|nr:TLC domain-containing protein 1-like [Acipenser oxyrinchus oxyrinchus]